MNKDPFGIWEITVPPKVPGVCPIPHDSKVKVRTSAKLCENIIHDMK